MNIRVDLTPSHYELSFKYDPVHVAYVKSIGGARWQPSRKLWTVPRTRMAAEELKRRGLYHDEAMLLGEHHHNVEQRQWDGWTLMEGIKPRAYQEQFIEINKTKKRLLLRGDMGVGKTLMALMYMAENRVHPESILIICPSSLVYNWRAEIERFYGLQARVLVGTSAKRLRELAEPGIHVVNYEWVVDSKSKTARIKQEILDAGKTVLIMDESHKCKNHSARRSKAIAAWTSDMKIAHCLLLTGTPISQGVQDYFSQFKILDNGLFGQSFLAFRSRYCDTVPVKYGPPGAVKIIGAKNLDELMGIIRPYVYEIRKADCLDLPEKTYQMMSVEMSSAQVEAYLSMKYAMNAMVKEDADPVMVSNVLAKMTKLAQITQGYLIDENRKVNQIGEENPKLEMLGEILEAASGPVVVVCRFVEDIRKIQDLCDKLGKRHGAIYGEVEVVDRQRVVDSLQRGELDVVIGQIQTMGVGYNMTAASTMVFYSNSFSLVDRLQCEDRIHRIGQENNCHYIDIAATRNGAMTIDHDVINALRNKNDFAEYVSQVARGLVSIN